MLSKTLALNEIVLNDNNLQPNYIASFKGKPLFYRTRVRSLAMLVTNSLTYSRLVNLIDVTLACEDANSKRVDVVTFTDIDVEKHVDDSLVQIWKLKFGHKAKFCTNFEHKVWLRVWSWS